VLALFGGTALSVTVTLPPAGSKTLDGPVTELPPEGLGGMYDRFTVPDHELVEVIVRLEVSCSA